MPASSHPASVPYILGGARAGLQERTPACRLPAQPPSDSVSLEKFFLCFSLLFRKMENHNYSYLSVWFYGLDDKIHWRCLVSRLEHVIMTSWLRTRGKKWSTWSKTPSWVWGNVECDTVKVKVALLCLTLCDPMDSIVHGILQAGILEWVALSLLQGIFPAQGSNAGLLHWGRILYRLSHKGSPRILEWVTYPFSREIFPTQELNGGLLHCRWILYQLSYEGSPSVIPRPCPWCSHPAI